MPRTNRFLVSYFYTNGKEEWGWESFICNIDRGIELMSVTKLYEACEDARKEAGKPVTFRFIPMSVSPMAPQ